MTVILFSNIQPSLWFTCSPFAHIHTCATCEGMLGVGDDGWYGKWREQAERRKCRVTLDIGCVTSWKLGPEETIYHIIHTPPKTVSGERIDGKEKRERQWQSSYVDSDISFNFVSRIRRQVQSRTNTDDIFRYNITTILLSMIQREIDYLLYVRSSI